MRRFLRLCMIALALAGGVTVLSGCIVVPPRAAHAWVPGHWVRGNVWIGGHWRDR